MIITSAEFVKSAEKLSQYPPAEHPEIAFAGRSNVGKSSLINRLLNRKNLVKTSSTPGRTRLLNFFLINTELSFVDLPGYGFAKVPLSVKKKWGPMIETYLSKRETLKGVILTLDVRRTPGPEERDLMAWFEHHRIPVRVVITKTDKLSRSRQIKQHREIAGALALKPEQLLLFSAKSGRGKREVWEAIKIMLGTGSGG